MSTDLQDIIASSSIKAFNAGYQSGKAEGYEAGIAKALAAAKFVSFDDDRFGRILAIRDLEFEASTPNNGRNAT